jgi:hypothetical protein
MKCASCEAQVPASFGHAIKKNECPACGGALMDEESMAVIEELRGFILQTVKVREETADTLAMALITTYDISGRNDHTVPFSSRRMPKTKSKEEVKEVGDGGFVKASDLFDPDNPISTAEREQILQERMEERLMTQAMIPKEVATRMTGSSHALSDSEMAENPILEMQRLQRLQKQEACEHAGLSKIHRSE